MSGMLTAFARAVATATLLFVFVGAAFGHAVMVDSEPPDGAVLETAPAHIAIRFDEPVSLISAQLLDAAGRNVMPSGGAAASDREVRIALPPSPEHGTYVASYRVVSLDGHPVSGSIVFSIGAATTRSPMPTLSPDDWGWRVAMIGIRVALDAGILGGAGGALFLWLIAPGGAAAQSTVRIARRLALIGCCAAVLAIGVQGGLLTGGPMQILLDPGTWRTGLVSIFGRSNLAALLGLAIIAASLGRNTPIAFAGAAITLASFALSGHVVTAGPLWLTVPVLVTHVSAIAFWMGSLLPLRSTIALDGPEAVPLIRRFSDFAIIAVGLLILAGAIIAILQVGSFAGLVTTSYGWLLLTKLALVAALLALATFNKLRLTPALAHGESGAVGALRRAIAAEILFALLILIATAALGTTPPPRVLLADGAAPPDLHSAHGHHARPVTITLNSAGYRATVIFASQESGPNAADIELTDAAGTPLAAKEVLLIVSNPSAGVEPMSRKAELVKSGRWRIAELMLVPAGHWSIRLEALVDDFEKPIFEGQIEIR